VSLQIKSDKATTQRRLRRKIFPICFIYFRLDFSTNIHLTICNITVYYYLPIVARFLHDLKTIGIIFENLSLSFFAGKKEEESLKRPET